MGKSNNNLVNNNFGLKRHIPSEVKQIVRQRCGFGCVICGNAIYQYEHFNPEFKDATAHDPNGITLLCGGCHDRKSRGLISTQTVIHSNANPKTKTSGYSWGPFDIGINHPEIIIGNISIINTEIPIRAFGDKIFSIQPSNEANQPFKINAFLKDSSGNVIIQIKDNEWLTSNQNWDAKVEGQRITIKSLNKIELILRSEPPEKIVIEKLFMIHKGARIECKENKNLILQVGKLHIETTSAKIKNAKVGIDILKDSINLGLEGDVFISSIEFKNT